ncbi:hypothetical protein WAK64_19050 [Bacillus spongiae]|uniref:Uncharacterized protein n=1 Tax=Bacillus spongiae TaxID=2683610 RepID=A0ABU8HIX5_9BACI
MKSEEYFIESQYTGKHFHGECWEPIYECYIELIVEERKDGSWDVFLDGFLDDYEDNLLLNKLEYQDTPTGMFLFNAKDHYDVKYKLKDWVENVLSRVRKAKTKELK